MSIKTLILTLVLFFLSLSATSGNLVIDINQVVNFSNEEKKWIKEHQDVKVALRRGWAPIEFLNEGNKPIGLSVSLLKSIEKVSGLKFTLVQAHDSGPNSETADVVASVPSAKIFEETRFTPLEAPYISIPYAIFTNNKGLKKVTSIEDLKGKQVAVFKSGKVVELLEKDYPEIMLYKVDIATEALEALILGSVDAYIGNMLVVSYNAKNEGFGNITLSSETPYSANIYMGIREDWPMLHSIMAKSIEAIPKEQKTAMLTNWSGVNDERNSRYALFFKVALAILIFSLFIALWNWQLKKEVKQRRLAEEKLRLLSTSVQQVDDIILITDAKPKDQRIVFVNDAFEHKTGYTREDAIGESPKMLQGPKTSQDKLAEIRQSLSEWRPIRLELINYTKDGNEYWLDLKITPIMDSAGTVTNWMSIERDISEQKAIELELLESKKQAEAASVAKSNFLANMSHEIRTPMNAVLGMTTLLLDTKLEEKQLEYLNIVNNSATALLDIMNDILDSSKIEAGKLEVEFVEFSLHKVVNACVEMFALVAQEKGINLICYVDVNLAKFIITDPVRLRQILLNLLSNAIKFTEKGSVSLQVNLLHESNAIYDIEIKVIDSGIGMTREELNMLYQPFTQADSSISKKFGGTGLGLSISKELISMMNGHISVESEVGQGTIFTLNFPMQVGEESIKRFELKWMEGKKVLIFDENSLRASMVKKYLDYIGASTTILKLKEKPSLASDYDLVIASSKCLHDELSLGQNLASDNNDVKRLLLSNQFTTQAEELFSPDSVINEPFTQLELYKMLEVIFGYVENKNSIHNIETIEKNKQIKTLSKLYKGVVLIVDDNPLNLQVTSALLKKIGIESQEASDGAEALKMIKAEKFSLILMDCQMPEISGFEVAKLIRDDELGSGERVPIIALTASAMVGDKERCLSAGMDDYLPKPIDVRRLRSVVEQWMTVIEIDANTVPTNDKKSDVVEDYSKVMNETVLKEMFQNDESTINTLLEQFLALTPAMLVKLESSVELSDMDSVEKHCHKIKGSSSTYGFEELSEACAMLEQAAKLDDKEAVRLLYKKVIDVFERLRKYLIQDVLNH